MKKAARDLCRRVGEVLRVHWDPIGVADAPEARDEHEGYASALAGLLMSGAGGQMIAARLIEIERSELGLVGDALRARDVAERLCGLVGG